MFPEKFFQIKCRLSEIDTPEIIGESHTQALVARNRVIQLIANIDAHNMKRNDVKEFFNTNNFYVYLKCGSFDKYGRLLVKAYTEHDFLNEGECINKILLSENLAIPYFD
jgi:endonuclease YncB( thermonuclease family)